MSELFVLIAVVLCVLSGAELVLIYLQGVEKALQAHIDEYDHYNRNPREVYRVFMTLLYGSWVTFVCTGIFLLYKSLF